MIFVFFYLVIVVHEALVCPEQLNCVLFFRKTLQLTLIIWFSSIFVYLDPFQLWLYDFEIHIFTPRDSYATITEDSNTHWCSGRQNHALRAGVWKLLKNYALRAGVWKLLKNYALRAGVWKLLKNYALRAGAWKLLKNYALRAGAWKLLNLKIGVNLT